MGQSGTCVAAMSLKRRHHMARNANTTGFLALVGLGAYYLYRNRYRIQKFLESQGIKTPLDTSSVGSAISSGVSKISGQLQGGIHQADKDLNRKTG
jgi:uncharacterized membrane protein YebE (DUF533 family)